MLALGAVGIWFGYRIVNYSVFADFLIAVEAEMNKVSWPTRRELWNASVVVMFVIFAMAAAHGDTDAVENRNVAAEALTPDQQEAARQRFDQLQAGRY